CTVRNTAMRPILCLAALALSGLVAPATSVRADNWPQWRGPEGNGLCRETGLASEWSAKKNVAWKLTLPGMPGSTPIIWGDRIFLTRGDGRDLVLLGISTDGKQLWKRKLGTAGRLIIKKDEGNEASASPSTDGKHVWAFAGSGHVACFDFDGKEIWKFNVQD